MKFLGSILFILSLMFLFSGSVAAQTTNETNTTDVAVIAITITPEEPEPNSIIMANTTVQNRGSISVSVTVDQTFTTPLGRSGGVGASARLGPNEKEIFILQFLADSAGEYEVTSRVEISDQFVNDSNLTNNELSVRFTIPGDIPKVTDVAVTSINISPENPQLNDAVNASILIQNLGNVSVNVSTSVEFKGPLSGAGGGGCCTLLAPGETHIVPMSFTVDAEGTYLVNGSVAISDQNIIDSNPGNNELSIRFTVSEPTLEERVTELEARVDGLESRVGILEAAVDAIQEAIDALQQTITEILGYLTTAPPSARRHMICGYMEDANLTNHTALGLSCEIINETCSCAPI